MLIFCRSIIGSGIGGCLADPVSNYPNIFPRGTIWEFYPYLLPNVVSAVVVLFGLAIGVLFLEETHEKKRDNRDLGLEIGHWLSQKLRPRQSHVGYTKLEEASYEETAALMQDNSHPPSYDAGHKSCASPTAEYENHGVQDPTSIDAELAYENSRSPPSCFSAFNKQVLLNVVAYGILA